MSIFLSLQAYILFIAISKSFENECCFISYLYTYSVRLAADFQVLLSKLGALYILYKTYYTSQREIW